jgi:hypothetical protein
LRVGDKLSKTRDLEQALERKKNFLLKREMSKEEKNGQKGGGRGRGRETRGFTLLPKLVRKRELHEILIGDKS